MSIESPSLKDEERKRYLRSYIIIILAISIILILLRIIFYFFEAELSTIFIFDLLIHNRDLNFETNYYLMNNGIFNYYQENPFTNNYGIYLYFWYFIFFPFYLLPLEISVYFWDIFRLSSTIYIAINIKKLNLNKSELSFFFLFSSIGYLADMYLNNTNWLIQLFLYQSYIYLEKEKKLLSGLFFTLAVFKPTLIVFPFILIIIKRIRLKDLFYYFFPVLVISIPYIIFPNYFLSMISNWFISVETPSGLVFGIWRLIQPAHLMYISIILVVINLNIKNEKLRNKINLLLYSLIFVFWILIWLVLLEIALFF